MSPTKVIRIAVMMCAGVLQLLAAGAVLLQQWSSGENLDWEANMALGILFIHLAAHDADREE